MRIGLLAAIAVLGVLPITAAATVADGNIVGDGYGTARSVQAVQTQFGDNFSELDAAYAQIAGGRLFLALTGNLEDNFNKLEILIDSRAGGENVFSGTPGNDGSGVMTGLTFDSGFDADYHIVARRGSGTPSGRFDLDLSELGTPNFSSHPDVFGGTTEGAAMTPAGPANVFPIGVGYDNSNVAGVTGGTGAANQAAALAVTTGFEVSVDLADIGSPLGAFKIMAFVNNSGHDFASNQFLGPLTPPRGNLGGDGFGNFTGSLTVDLNDFPGDQFFIVPEPTTLSLLALGGLALLRRRR